MKLRPGHRYEIARMIFPTDFKIADQRRLLVASARYLERFGVPGSVEELKRHRLIDKLPPDMGRPTHVTRSAPKYLISSMSPRRMTEPAAEL